MAMVTPVKHRYDVLRERNMCASAVIQRFRSALAPDFMRLYGLASQPSIRLGRWLLAMIARFAARCSAASPVHLAPGHV